MPIKPENAARYPKDWKQIRKEVLERAGHKCENCGLANYVVGYREKDGTFVPLGSSWDSAGMSAADLVDGKRVFKIVLTVAHRNHQPEDCGEPGNRPNLAAWCQRCHLAYDNAHHMRNAHQTRRNRKAIGDLFA